jgi:hypothetical protein
MRHTANVLDRIRSVLRSPSPTSNDVAIDLRPFLSDSPVHMDDSTFSSLATISRQHVAPFLLLPASCVCVRACVRACVLRACDADFLPYGSLIPREDSKASNSIFKTLATKTQKDALNAIRKKLMNVITQESLPLQSKSSVHDTTRATHATPKHPLTALRADLPPFSRALRSPRRGCWRCCARFRPMSALSIATPD